MSVQELSKAYNPKDVEDKWYSWWESNHLFHGAVNREKTPYAMVIPPPNITGILTMGHVLNNTLQDVFVRWKRMQGFEACWIPGTDHAGIATQNAVEKSLAKEGKHRRDLGREKFIELVWQWRDKYGSTIIRQLRKLGVSCDWERERFTMDEGLSNAVKEVFIRLFDKGLIYRGKYIVNWCPQHQTALSDDEVDHTESNGNLYYIKYPIFGSEEAAIVATTRPETMLGDTALCVHPKDERFQHLIGKTAVLPIVGRKLPIIADDYIDLSFGTGVMKVTPAHDTNDFLLSQRHDLPQLNIFDETAHLNASVPKEYEGMDRFECRTQLVKDLEAQHLLVKIEPYAHNIGKCYRCQTVIEPWLSDQWFVKMKPLAAPALRVVHEGKVQFHPDRWTKVYEHWMTNIRDWCISRQIWWGHRIPVYYAPDGNYVVARNEDEARKKLNLAPDVPIRQDEDVLDTWFSSWLWPFSTLGWPEDNADLHYFNPTSTLVTAPDIIFFWVARMIMANMEFMKGTPGRDGKPRKKDDDLIPFRDVYFTSIIRDEQGRKMSKSLGNSPDPLDVIDQYGADALRFTIAYLSPLGQDVMFSSEKCDLGRNFANKIWNAGRFLLMNKQEITGDRNIALDTMPADHLDLADRWILSRLHHAINTFNTSLEQFHVNEATKLLYDFIWHDFCDWYVEMVKTRFYGDEPNEAKTAVVTRALWIFDQALRLMHPVMPFISEELWQNLSDRKGQSLVRAAFPEVNEQYINQTVEDELNFVIKIVEAVRNIRGELNVAPSKQIEVHVHLHGEFGEKLAVNANVVQGLLNYIDRLCKAKTVPTWARASEVFERPKASASAVIDGTEIYVPLVGIIDLDAERKRLEKEIARLKGLIDGIGKKLTNASFVERAPKEVVDKEREKQKNMTATMEKLIDNVNQLG
ncbi:MAG: valine--tRNA ligase [Ignavibacteriae bacterium]|nr:MAG: valine--tRNA ligase [Ignavibacteriota bacterium]